MADSRSPEYRRALPEVVHNQLRDGTPPETRATLDRLVAGGYSREQAVETIAGAVEAEMLAVLRARRPFDEARYTAALRAL
ncbi:MAG: hypothetical protein C0501_13880 [Isosphaera sp.]|nr:hypothetical protein [Isosphaera sp.]